jgi:cellulose synthase (UDP-forming)
LSPPQRERLQLFLYCRPGVWPERQAPLEPLALLAVFARLLVGCRSETWFRRSLIEQAVVNSDPTGSALWQNAPTATPPQLPAPAQGAAEGQQR